MNKSLSAHLLHHVSAKVELATEHLELLLNADGVGAGEVVAAAVSGVFLQYGLLEVVLQLGVVLETGTSALHTRTTH